jgi:2-C-methyl-D-erythritol 2,4-cyclodiphosphate synthase
MEGRRLVLGGEEIPYHKGLAGHSDADVLTHAVCDAILGALGEGDLGRMFPDTEQRYKDISSLVLLREVSLLMKRLGYAPSNVDATVIAASPRLARHVRGMEEKIADCLGVDSGKVNVKATNPEGLGTLGREEGIAAYAVCLLVKT